MLCHTLLRFLAFANPKDTIGCNWAYWARQDGFEVDEEPEDDERQCQHCEDNFNEEDMYYINDEWYCEDCKDDLFTMCERCESYIDRNNVSHVNDYSYCDHCYNEYCTTCDNCGDNILSDDSVLLTYSDESETYVCYHCHKELECQICETHGNLVKGDCVCEDCLEERNELNEDDTIDENTNQEGISDNSIPTIPESI